MLEITARLSTALADRYDIERHRGEGGMATVYLAENLRHKRKVALKILKSELAALGTERFVQQIKTSASLQHPNSCPCSISGEADSFLYYVMPYVEGETLRDKLNRETQLSIDEAGVSPRLYGPRYAGARSARPEAWGFYSGCGMLALTAHLEKSLDGRG